MKKSSSSNKSSRESLTAIRKRIVETVVAREYARIAFAMSRSKQLSQMTSASTLANLQRLLATDLEIENADLLESFSKARYECTHADKENFSVLIPSLERFGPFLFLTKNGEPNLLFYQWINLWEDAAMGDSDAEAKYKQITKALLNFPSGRRSHVKPDKRSEQKRTCNAKHGTKRNHRQTAERLVQQIREREHQLLKSGEKPNIALQKATTAILHDWQRERARTPNPSAIIAIVKEILSKN